jgi:hypothetical protein
MTNASASLTPTWAGLTAKPQDKLDDVRKHQINKQEEDRGNSGHHEDCDGGGPGFATRSPGNTRYFLADLPYKLRWRCLCHSGEVPIRVSQIISDTMNNTKSAMSRGVVPAISRFAFS